MMNATVQRAMTRRTLILALLTSGAMIGASASAAEPRLALSGYDPVAYFTNNAPTQGNPDITYDYDETRYRFASAQNRSLFAANPDKYAPRYNGYCAMAMSKGAKTEPDPQNWTIVDGHLYVFARPADRIKLAQDKSWIDQGSDNWVKLKP